MSCTPDGDEIADPTMIQVGDIRYLRRAGGLPPLRPVLGIAHAQDPAFGFQSEPSTGLRQDPDTGTVYWRRNGVDLYSMDDGGSGGDVAVTSITPVASDRLLGRDTAGSGACEELTVGGGLEFTGSGGIQRSALTGDVTASAGSGSLTIASDAVTYAKMQNVSATDRLLGRSTAGAGDVEEIPCTAAGRALLDDADAAAQRTTLGLAIGTDVQAYDAGLASLAALPTVADRLAYSTAADTWAETALTTFGRSLIDDADAAAGRDTLGASAGIWGLAVGGTAADLSATGGTGQFLRQSSAGAAITVGVIGHADLGSGGGSGSKYLRDDMTWQTLTSDHGALTGLGDDDHAQYALLAGRSGGQTLIGGTASGDDLTLQSTSHATRGNIFFGSGGTHTFNEATGNWGLGIAVPTANLHVKSTSYGRGTGLRLGDSSGDNVCDIYGYNGLATCFRFKTRIGFRDYDAGLGFIPGQEFEFVSPTNSNWTLSAGYTHAHLGSNNRCFHVGVAGPLASGGTEVTADATYNWLKLISNSSTTLSGGGTYGFASKIHLNYTGVGIAINSELLAARALEVRSTSAQQRWSYDASNYAEIAVSSAGAVTLTATGASDGFCIGDSGDNIGFYGVTTVARPAAYTQTYSTADRTLAAYTADNESAAYTGIDNAQVGTVYAQLTDLNALRVAYENLRAFVEDLAQHHNSVLDDLQAVGLLQ